VHHRVKNNLQIIASLLNLQARNVDGSARAVLQESNNRVRAMALTHQLLYERNDFSGLELGPYLQRLGMLLRETYLAAHMPIQLEVDVTETGLRIDLQQAIPCGLIVNELVTNAIKHAFPGGRGGCVTVTAKAELPHCVRVTVADNGVGLPPGTTLESRGSLGFQLMPLLADQLGSKLELIAGTGTQVSWSFPLSEVMHESYQ
jgi:two-component system, sensor histidine kinase PdtaS